LECAYYSAITKKNKPDIPTNRFITRASCGRPDSKNAGRSSSSSFLTSNCRSTLQSFLVWGRGDWGEKAKGEKFDIRSPDTRLNSKRSQCLLICTAVIVCCGKLITLIDLYAYAVQGFTDFIKSFSCIYTYSEHCSNSHSAMSSLFMFVWIYLWFQINYLHCHL